MTIIEKFEQIVEKYSERVAVLSELEGTLNYNQLNQAANYVANLIDESDSSTEVIGVCMDRSFLLIASILGILKSKRAYLPIDASYPEERIEWMIQSANVKTVICTKKEAQLFQKNTETIIMDQCNYSKDYNTIKDGSELFCIIFSSGSTGMPNGVAMTNTSIGNTLAWAINFYELASDDVSLQIPSCSFTSSVQDYFTTLLSGGTLLMIQDSDLHNMKRLVQLTKQYHVTHFDMVPSLYEEYLRYLDDACDLRFVLVAGESLSPSLVEQHFNKIETVRMVNEYGMAETSSCFSFFEMKKGAKKVYIGKPIDHMRYYLDDCDEDGIGELWIAGPGLVKGYYNNLNYTRERFEEKDGVRYYKTGDYVKVTDSFGLEYIGRKDNQFKINGKRINLNECDYILENDENVLGCKTVGLEYNSKQIIVSFIKSTKEDVSYFETLLKEKLPAQYIPNFIRVMKEFTYLPNGKLNVRLLKETFLEEIKADSCDENRPFGEMYQVIEECAPVLRGKLNTYDDLRKQGVDSLTLLKIVANLEMSFEVDFGFEGIDSLDVISIENLYTRIMSLKVQKRGKNN